MKICDKSYNIKAANKYFIALNNHIKSKPTQGQDVRKGAKLQAKRLHVVNLGFQGLR